MTVKYIHKVASGTGMMSLMLLKRWRGSVYKVVWRDLVAYLVIYYSISAIYRFALSADGRSVFERLVIHCSRFQDLIPVSFVLGFYVSLVVSRWWETYRTLPWPDNTAILVATHLPGQSEVERAARLGILRYVLLTITLTFATISPVVKNEMPTLQDMMMKNYLTEEELKILTKLKEESEQHVAWVPILWACKTVHRLRQENYITTDLGHKSLTDELLCLRKQCGRLLGYNSHNIPLVYAQVVTVAVYSFFLFSMVGEQFLDPTKNYPDHAIDLYVPFFALLQLVFYVGWLRVAEALLNPFGDDDHDFEFLSIINRHIKMTEMLGEKAPSDPPELLPRRAEGEAASPAPPVVPPLLCKVSSITLPKPMSLGGSVAQETTPLVP